MTIQGYGYMFVSLACSIHHFVCSSFVDLCEYACAFELYGVERFGTQAVQCSKHF